MNEKNKNNRTGCASTKNALEIQILGEEMHRVHM